MFSHRRLPVLVAAMLAMAGCVSTGSHKTFQAEGETGSLIVFTADQSPETAGVLLDNRFISGLNHRHYVEQKVCEGEYLLRVRSLSQNSKVNQRIGHEQAHGVVKVEKGDTVYVEAVRVPNGWKLQATDKTRFDEVDATHDHTGRDVRSYVVRRVVENTVKCK